MKTGTRKKLLLILLAITGTFAAAFGVVACKTDSNAGDAHSFNEKWSNDESSHWHACLDGGCSEKEGVEQHTFGAPKQTKEPTCYSLGEQVLTCTVCGYEKTESVATVRHNWSEEWSWDEAGKQHYHVCINDGCTANNEAAFHGEWIDKGTVTEPTCTKEGVKNVECGVCHYTTTASIDVVPNNHAWSGEWSWNGQKHYKECTNDGCNEIKSDAEHVWKVLEITQAATCAEGGVEKIECTVCHYITTRTTAINSENHVWSEEWSWDEEKGVHYHKCTNSSCPVTTDIDEHTYERVKVTKEPACTVKGEEEVKCTTCKHVTTRSIPQLNHDFSSAWSHDDEQHYHECLRDGCNAHTDAADHGWDNGVVTTSATCTEAGVKTYTCSVCDATKTEDIAATGHTYGNWQTTTSATCTAEGEEKRTCTVSGCGHEETRTIEALGHDIGDEGVVTKAPTCTETGIKKGECTRCHETFNDEHAATIPALGHAWNDGTVTTPATCETAGVKTFTCSRCDDTKTEDIEATGHAWNAGVVTTPATCETKGVKTFTCTNDGTHTKTEDIKALGHSYSSEWSYDGDQHYHSCTRTDCNDHNGAAAHEWTVVEVTKVATCAAKGEEKIECSVCHYETTRTTPINTNNHVWSEAWTCSADGSQHYHKCTNPSCTATTGATGHTYGEWVVPAHLCDVAVQKTRTCTGCGHEEIDSVPAKAHQYGDWVTTTAPTCTEKGVETQTCRVCSHEITRDINAKGHSFGNWTATTEATCTTDGEESRTCGREGCNFVETRTVEALGHDYAGWEITYPTKTETGSATNRCSRDESHNVEVELPILSVDEEGYTYDMAKGDYVYSAEHELGEITFTVHTAFLSTVEEAVKRALEVQKDVVSAETNRNNTMVAADGNAVTNNVITFERGNNYAHINDTSEEIEYFYSLNEDGSLFAVKKSFIGGDKGDDNGNGFSSYTDILISKDENATVNSMNGYAYGFTFLTQGVGYNGLSTFIDYLYKIGKINVNKDFAESIKTENGKTYYCFSFGQLVGKYFNVIDVEFCFDSNYVVSNAKLNAKTYVIKESEASPYISVNDSHVTLGADGYYYYDGKLLITTVEEVIGPDGTKKYNYIYPTPSNGQLYAPSYIDSDGTPRPRITYTSYFEQRADGTYRVVPGNENNWSNKEEFVVTQRSVRAAGEAIPTNPYSHEQMVLNSCDIKLGGVEINENTVITVDANVAKTFTIENVTPETYNANFDRFYIFLTDESGHKIDGTSTNNLQDGQIGYSFYTGNNGYEIKNDYTLTIKSLLVGEYTLHLCTEQREYTLKLVVNRIAADPLYMEVEVYNDLTDKTSWSREINSTTIYKGQELVFRGTVDHPAYENGNYNVKVTKNDIVMENLVTTKTVNGVTVHTFSTEVAGTYMIGLMPYLGTSSPIYVNVQETPDVASMLVGDFSNDDKGYQVTITPAETDALNGTATIVKDLGGTTETTVISYIYNTDTRTFTCAYVSGAKGAYVQGQELPYNYGLELSKSYKLYLTYSSGFSGERVKVLIGGFENAIVCEGSSILSNNSEHASKHIVNVSGIYRITSSHKDTFISINGGNNIKLDGSYEVALYVGDYFKIWNITSTASTYSVELIEKLQTIYVTDVSFTNSEANVSEGKTLTLKPQFTPANTTQKGLIWTSSDESIATVDDNGIVTGVSAGEVTVTATTINGKYSASIKINVIPANTLTVGKNVISFTMPTTQTGGNLEYQFKGEEGRTYVVSATYDGTSGNAAITCNGATYNCYTARFEVTGGDWVKFSIAAYSYGSTNLTIKIFDKDLAPNYTELNVGGNKVTVDSGSFVCYTIVGEPNTKYTVSSSGVTFYVPNSNGTPNYGTASDGSKTFTTDANGWADICAYISGTCTLTVTEFNTSDYPELSVGDTVLVSAMGDSYYKLVGSPNTDYTLVAYGLTFYDVEDGTKSTYDSGEGYKTYTTDANGFVNVCVSRTSSSGTDDDYTITVQQGAIIPKPKPRFEAINVDGNGNGSVTVAAGSGMTNYATYTLVGEPYTQYILKYSGSGLTFYDYDDASNKYVKDNSKTGSKVFQTDENGYVNICIGRTSSSSGNGTVTVEAYTAHTMYTALYVTDTLCPPNDGWTTLYTLVGSPNTAYTLTASGVTFYNFNNYIVDYESAASGSKTYVTDGDGYVNIAVEGSYSAKYITIAKAEGVVEHSGSHTLAYNSKDAYYHTVTCTADGCIYTAKEEAHVYDDDSDATCNKCGYTRIIGGAPETNYTALYVSNAPFTMISATGFYTLVGEPYTQYTLSSNDGKGTFYGYTEAGKLDSANKEIGSKTYTTDANGLVDIYLYGVKDKTISVTKVGVVTPPTEPETITVGQVVTVSGASFNNPVIYKISLEAATYNIYVGGSKLSTIDLGSDVVIRNGKGDDAEGLTTDDGNLVIGASGTYYLFCYTDDTVKVAKSVVHNPDDPNGPRTFEVDAPPYWGTNKVEVGDMVEGEEVTIVIKNCPEIGGAYRVYMYDKAYDGYQNPNVDIIADGYETDYYLVLSTSNGADITFTVIAKADFTGVVINVEDW